MAHVRFGEVSDRHAIDVSKQDESTVTANLGFLQDQHIYRVHMHVPIGMTPSLEASTNGELDISNVAITRKGAATDVDFDVRLAGVHGQMTGAITVGESTLAIRASVLKSTDGTPSLKEGIRITQRLESKTSSNVSQDQREALVA